jgi:MerR family redox-sensitive transcriptional activator SoxR
MSATRNLSRKDLLGIGKIAERTGLAISAIRYYEDEGLILPTRDAGGRRQFKRSDIRRLAFIQIAQQLGLSIADIREAFRSLPEQRTPTERDWQKLSRLIREALDNKINALTRMRDTLDGCIGCGCLSLKRCKLYNNNDKFGANGPGPRIMLGDLSTGK